MDNSMAEMMALCNKDNMGGFGGIFGLFVLFLLFGMIGGNGGWGWGGNNAAAQGALTRAELVDEFNTNNIQRNQSDIIRDQFGLQNDIFQNRYDIAMASNNTQREILENRFASQQCCCNTQKEILENRYATQLAFNNMQAQLAQCCCDLKTTMHSEGEATRALIQADIVQTLRDNLQSAQIQLSQLSQTAALKAAINPPAQPVYMTYPQQPVYPFPAANNCASACC